MASGVGTLRCDFRELHERLYPDEKLTDKQIVSRLGLKLTHTRVGQLVNTARAFPRDQVDQSIDFNVYEKARLIKPRLTPEKRLQLVKDHPSTAEMAQIKPPAPGRKPPPQALVINIEPADVEGDPPEVVARLNRAIVELPEALQVALRKYAVKLFAERTKSDE